MLLGPFPTISEKQAERRLLALLIWRGRLVRRALGDIAILRRRNMTNLEHSQIAVPFSLKLVLISWNEIAIVSVFRPTFI